MVTFTPSRTSQPYRRGQERAAGPTLAAMLAGRSLFQPNPMDLQREMAHRARLSQLLATRLQQRR